MHTLPEDEARAAYEAHVTPETGRIFFQGAVAPFDRHSAATVNFENTSRAPLLLIAGEQDHIVPAAVVRRTYAKYAHSSARTDYRLDVAFDEDRLGGRCGAATAHPLAAASPVFSVPEGSINEEMGLLIGSRTVLDAVRSASSSQPPSGAELFTWVATSSRDAEPVGERQCGSVRISRIFGRQHEVTMAFEQPRITVVNDNPEFLAVMGDLLTDERYPVTLVDGDRDNAMDLIRGSEPEALIIDLRLGTEKLHGWDILTEVRADAELRELPVLVCTGDLEGLQRLEVELAAMPRLATLRKPFAVNELLTAVDRLVGPSAR